jgi:hypothetical protein
MAQRSSTSGYGDDAAPILQSWWSSGIDDILVGYGSRVAWVGDVDDDGYDDLLVSSPTDSDGGTVYLYYGGASGLSFEAGWSATLGQANADFGTSLAGGDVNGDGYDDILVSAPSYDDGETDEGAVFLFLGGPSGPSTSPDWSVESDQANADMGDDIDIVGDVEDDGYDDILIGLPDWDGTKTNEGAAWYYAGSASGPATTPSWTLTLGQTSAFLGQAVAGAGDVDQDGYDDIVFGVPYYNDPSTDEGAVMLFLGSASGPASSVSWTYEVDTSSRYIGTDVSGAGDVNGDGYDDLAVGARSYATGGRGLVFHGGPSGLSATPDWTGNPSARSGQHCGESIDGAGDVNADGWDDLVLGCTGSTAEYAGVYVFLGSASGLSTSAVYSYESVYAVGVGDTVSGGGDPDGDGYEDIAFGDPLDGADAGAAFVISGSSAGPAAKAVWGWEASSTSTSIRVSEVGDLDGDGYEDVAASARDGSYYVYAWLGGPSGFSTSPDATLSPSGLSSSALPARGGDVDGDGYDELLVGEYVATVGVGSATGTAWVFEGGATGPSTTAALQLSGTQAGGRFGVAAIGGQDLDGDGYDDVVIGADAFDDGETDEGRVYLFSGGSSGLSSTASWTFSADQASAYAGRTLSLSPDLNGDGAPDLLVGATQWDGSFTDEGGLFAFYGGGTLAASPDWTGGGGEASVYCYIAESLGDVDGDGYSDAGLGCPNADSNRGRAMLFRGGASGPTDSGWRGEGELANDRFGSALQPLGDLDGDSYGDFAVSAPYAMPSGIHEQGSVGLYYGAADGQPTLGTLLADPETGRRLGSSMGGGIDSDGDGVIELLLTTSVQREVVLHEVVDSDADHVEDLADCAPTDPTVHGGARDICDGIDNDCDGELDEDPPTWYTDGDGDGYGDASSAVAACTAPSGTTAIGGDCDDGDATVSPAASERCDSQDNDCDGETDEAEAIDASTWHPDADLDGYGDTALSSVACVAPAGSLADGTDCDDGDAAVSPAAAEVCDGDDEDCDGNIDEGVTILSYVDVDGDGYGDSATEEAACSLTVGRVGTGGDCDDTDGAVSPAGFEVCDGQDDDCDGTVDEGVGGTWYSDGDGDGYGDPATATAACSAPPGTVPTSGDCDDTSGTRFPGAAEVCDDLDQDCDGDVDEGVLSTFHTDADADGYGDPASSTEACAATSGTVADDTDCDDSDASVTDGRPWHADGDGDGYGAEAVTAWSCEAPEGFTGDDTDCDDADAGSHPGADEVWYDGTDEACDGGSDYDQDGDGHDADLFEGDDCDDTVATVYPGAEEIWYDGTDQDCDGNDDDQDGDGAAVSIDCDDEDPSVIDCDEGEADGADDATGDDGGGVDGAADDGSGDGEADGGGGGGKASGCATAPTPGGSLALLLSLGLLGRRARGARSASRSAGAAERVGSV